MDFLREKPLRNWLEERDTLIERPKLITNLPTLRASVPPVPLPPGISPEEAKEVIARTNWARGIAEGIAEQGGLTGKARVDFVDKFSHRVAEGIFDSSYLPYVRRGPGRPRKEKKPKTVRIGKEITREELEKTRPK